MGDTADMTCRIGILLATALSLTGCATPFDNQPLNRPITRQFVEDSSRPRDIVGRNVVALSLSGGGMRAAAFSFGVLQALADADQSGTDIFDDLTFMSSVSLFQRGMSLGRGSRFQRGVSLKGARAW